MAFSLPRCPELRRLMAHAGYKRQGDINHNLTQGASNNMIFLLAVPLTRNSVNSVFLLQCLFFCAFSGVNAEFNVATDKNSFCRLAGLIDRVPTRRGIQNKISFFCSCLNDCFLQLDWF